jgi:hypothetical protein
MVPHWIYDDSVRHYGDRRSDFDFNLKITKYIRL